MITVNGLSKVYKMGTVQTKALDNVSMSVEKGEFVAVTGRSGCGKSTLLNILGGMDNQTAGQYRFEDTEVTALRGRSLAKFRNKKIGFVFQSFYLVNEINAVNNISLPLGYAGFGGKQRKQTALNLLELVGLEGKARHRPSQLSGGEQQRVAIARAIANSPDLLLADEPTGNLDEENSAKIMELLQSLNQKGLTIIMVTHDLDLARQTNRIIKMADGVILNASSLED